ncbi:MAG: hypothetical protein QM727_09085 [Niabella sp.]
MKQIIMIYSVVFGCLMLGLTAHANEYESNFEKKKTIVRTYSLSPNQQVDIVNQFGKVEVVNWDKREVKAEITITVNARTEEVAQKILDNITIRESNSGKISFETKIGSDNSVKKNNKGDKKSMEINYVVYMPSTNPLTVKNSFGDTFIASRGGLTNLSQSFGDLNIGNLSRVSDLKVEFGKLKAEKIQVEKIKSSFSDVDVYQLAGDVQSKFEFCKKLSIGLSDKLENLDVDVSYSDLKLALSDLSDAKLSIKTSFGDTKNKSSIKLRDETEQKKYGPTFDKKYEAQVGNGKGTIVIKSSFGTVILLNSKDN